MPTPDIDNIYSMCGFPNASQDDVASWNKVSFGDGFQGEVSLGLFGYDISCLSAFCAGIDNADEDYSCNLVQARGLDGLAFGGYWKTEKNNQSGYYGIGFRNDTEENVGNSAVFHDIDGEEIFTVLFHNFYQVSADFPFDTTSPFLVSQATGMDLSSYKSEKGFSAGYGLGDLVWHSTFQYFYDSTDVFYYSQGFRFIGEKENDYARWSAGDTINLFSLDLYNKVYTDNPDFILAGAIELTIGSAVIAASVFLM